MSNKSAALRCMVKATKAGAETDLGSFQMLEGRDIAYAKLVPVFLFDYMALAEELVNRQLLDDEIEAFIVCEYIEHQLNDEGTWNGEYKSREGDVTITFVIEPEAVSTEDGYTFSRQEDGSYSDGDMSWPTFADFKSTCEVEWKAVVALCSESTL